jgi:hypothetical protein
VVRFGREQGGLAGLGQRKISTVLKGVETISKRRARSRWISKSASAALHKATTPTNAMPNHKPSMHVLRPG